MMRPQKYEFGSQMRKAKERIDMVIQSFAGYMDRFVKRKHNQSIEIEDSNNENENENENENKNEIENENVNTSLDMIMIMHMI